jgi:hypothetical protein
MKNTGFMRSVPHRTRYVRTRPRAPAKKYASRPSSKTQKAACHVFCNRLRYRLRSPAQETELFLCVRSSPSTSSGSSHLARPARALPLPSQGRIKTSSASCVRPARTRPLGIGANLRIANPMMTVVSMGHERCESTRRGMGISH